jgi:flagellar hook-basal body complex protein FliE
MSEINQARMLSEIKSTAAAAQGRTDMNLREAADPVDFVKLLQQSIQQVNTVQNNASSMAHAFEQGEPGVNLADVMVSLQKANIAFTAMTQVRNRLVSAYQDVMNMQI